MQYIIASDYDRTLYQNGTISIETIEAIKAFRAKGHLFGLVTGRDYTIGYDRFKKNNDFPFDFVVSNNGACAYDKDGNIYFSEQINGGEKYGESTLAQELIKRCLQLTSNPCGIAFERSKFNFHPNYPSGAKVEGKEYCSLSVLKEVGNFISANAICETNEQATAVMQTLKEEFGLYLNPVQNGRNIDITPAGVDKSTGIERLAACLGIADEYIWTAGDNFNDMTMLKKYHGCAMSSGVEELTVVAEYVCDSVADVIRIVLEKQKKCDSV